MALVSVWGRNWCYLCERVERVGKDETVEIVNIHKASRHVAEKMIGWRKRLGEVSSQFSPR